MSKPSTTGVPRPDDPSFAQRCLRKGRLRSEGQRASDDAPVQDAPVSAHLVIGDGSVKEATVVPNHQIALAPTVGINEIRLCRVVQKLVEQRYSFSLGHAEGVRGMIAEIKRLLAGRR